MFFYFFSEQCAGVMLFNAQVMTKAAHSPHETHNYKKSLWVSMPAKCRCRSASH